MTEQEYKAILVAEQISDLDAEIERLKGENARLKQLNLMTDEQVVMDLKAEIERLKKVISLDAVAIGNKNRIITELCDALDAYTPDAEGGYRKAKELIQHAREASK
jgi:uncharacterized small protein (DUF1192 family)